jgi:hypothetical protein
MPKPHVYMREVTSKEKDYREVINTVSRGINFVTFVDQKAVWMMSTTHDVVYQPPCWRDAVTRSNVSSHLSRVSEDGWIEISFPQLSWDYNHHMNSSDVC